MKRTLLFKSVLTLFMAAGLISVGLASSPSGKIPPARLNASKNIPLTTVSVPGFFFEDFESAAPDGTPQLPEGWKTEATPDKPDDIWSAGTLGRDGQPMYGHSGLKYAFLLGGSDQPHDAWLFSPGVRLSAGVDYWIDVYTYLPEAPGITEKHILKVYACSAQNANAIVSKITEIEELDNDWGAQYLDFTPEEDGTYYFAFQSLSPAGTNALAIDDLKVYTENIPAFAGGLTLPMGETDSRSGSLTADYEIRNDGSSPLEVSLAECSPEITVEGLPASVENTIQLKVTLNMSQTGDYEGFIKLNTNDPLKQQVTVTVTATMKESRITGYTFETFEQGGPIGWELCRGSANVSVYGGHNSSRAWYCPSYQYSEELDGFGFTTHYVAMGEKPEFSFWYKLADKKGGITAAEKVRFYVFVSSDNGLIWDTVYKAVPGTETQHIPSADYQKISVDLFKYAEDTCRIRLVFKQVSGNPLDDDDEFRALVDDVSIGTPVKADLRATALSGDATLEIGTEYTFSARLENKGTDTVRNYEIILIDLADTSTVATAAAQPIPAHGSTSVSFTYTPTKAGSLHLAAQIKSVPAEDSSNLISYPLHIIVLPENNSAITIGEGEQLQSMYYPVNFQSTEAASQFIYYANEIGISQGEINSLTFQSAMISEYFSEPFSVYVAETDRVTFDDGKLSDPSAFTKVFEGKVYFEGNKTDFVVPFDQAYPYKGGNLIVMTQKLGKEFIVGKYFNVRECKTIYRSICAGTYQPGTLVENGYADAVRSEVYPDVRINIVKAAAGSIAGKIADANGVIEGAQVWISGTQRYTFTAADGTFRFNEAATGATTLTVIKHGYRPLTVPAKEVNANAETFYDITIEELPQYTLKGTLRSVVSEKPVDRAFITLKGYDEFSTYSNADGSYEIPGIRGETGDSYRLFITSDYYANMAAEINVDNHLTRDFQLEEKPLHVHSVSAVLNSEEASITWNKPLPEFAHDAGIMDNDLGFSHGNEKTTLSSVFRKKARISEISWFMKGGYVHSNFNVFVFGLDSDGNPDVKKMLYVARDVDYVDGGWSIHTLSKPLEVDGFMVSISCDGFMGLGFSLPTDEYPYEYGQCYYAGDSYEWNLTEMAQFGEGHLMIRAYGDYLGEFHAEQSFSELAVTRPEANYNVYRKAKDATDKDWELLGSTQTESFQDLTLRTQAADIYQYAVAALYGDSISLPIKSNTLEWKGVNDTLGINQNILLPEENIISYNALSRELRIDDPSLVKKIVVVSSTGALYRTYSNVNGDISVADYSSGLYIATALMNRGGIRVLKFVKR